MGEDIGYDPDVLDDDILNRRFENVSTVQRHRKETFFSTKPV